jgi:hypothetical protein
MRRLAFAATLWLAACSLQMDLPPGFLRKRSEESGDLRAVTATGGRLRVRDFAVESHSTIGFWADAVRDEFAGRGYRLDDGHDVTDGAGRQGRAFRAQTVADGEPCGYFVAVFLMPGSWLPWSQDHVRVVEFTAATAEFDQIGAAVQAAVATLR